MDSFTPSDVNIDHYLKSITLFIILRQVKIISID